MSISGFCQVLKEEKKKCVIRIPGIELRKESKTHPESKQQDFPHLAIEPYILYTNPFLHQSSIANNSSAVWMAGIICSAFLVNCSNTWHHLYAIFRYLQVQATDISCSKFFVSHSNGWLHPFWNFSLAIQVASSVQSYFFSFAVQIFSICSKIFFMAVQFISCSLAFHFDCLTDIS